MFAGLGYGRDTDLDLRSVFRRLISCVIDSEGIREYGTPLVRTLLLSGPVMGILFIYINTLQAIGAEAAQPVADILSLLLAVWLFWRTEKRMGKAPSFV